MSKMSFDLSKEAWNSPTPKAVKIIYRILSGISGLWLAAGVPYLSGILPDHTMLIISSITGGSSTAIYFICQFFHWKTEEDGTSTN